jgi:flap endonuclease-1
MASSKLVSSSEDRVRKSVQKLIKFKSTSTQGRLDTFFKVIPSDKPKKRPTEVPKTATKKTKKR